MLYAAIGLFVVGAGLALTSLVSVYQNKRALTMTAYTRRNHNISFGIGLMTIGFVLAYLY